MPTYEVLKKVHINNQWLVPAEKGGDPVTVDLPERAARFMILNGSLKLVSTAVETPAETGRTGKTSKTTKDAN